jgi:hypothetical protein
VDTGCPGGRARRRADGARSLEPVDTLAARGDSGRPAGRRNGLVLRRDGRRRRRLVASRARLAHDGADPRAAAARRDLDGGRAPRGGRDHVRARRPDLVPRGGRESCRCGVHLLATLVRRGVTRAEVRHGHRAGDHGLGAAAPARPSPSCLPLRHHRAARVGPQRHRLGRTQYRRRHRPRRRARRRPLVEVAPR